MARYYNCIKNKSFITEIHMADIHFGSTDPFKQFTILCEQFFPKIEQIDFDILSIDGDIFDRKFMANSDAVMYAMEFVRLCTEICIRKAATLILISGTESHFMDIKMTRDLI